MFELHVFGYGTLEWLVNCFLRPLEGYSLLKAGGFMELRNLMVSVIKRRYNVGTTCFGLWYSGMARQLLLEGPRGKLPYLALRGLIFHPNWLEITKKA